MQELQPQDYFRRRAREEQTAAEQAADERAAQLHRELAQRYAMLASGESDKAGEPEQPGDAGILPNDFRILP